MPSDIFLRYFVRLWLTYLLTLVLASLERHGNRRAQGMNCLTQGHTMTASKQCLAFAFLNKTGHKTIVTIMTHWMQYAALGAKDTEMSSVHDRQVLVPENQRWHLGYGKMTRGPYTLLVLPL